MELKATSFNELVEITDRGLFTTTACVSSLIRRMNYKTGLTYDH